MNQLSKPEIAPGIFYVGIDRTDEHWFEKQYPIPAGMSYNSYVVVDRRIAVMDSVEAGAGEQWIANIEAATGGRRPDYIVVQHMEPDHSASVVMALHAWPEARIVCSAKAATMLGQFFPDEDFSGRIDAVKEGDVLELGEHRLTFFATPMIHWPEVIMSYESRDRVLFSADAFGKFGSLTVDDDWVSEARRYYINIVGKYGPQVLSALKKLSHLAIDIIAPLHGPVLDAEPERYIELYRRWASYEPEQRGVLVAYGSIYGGTEAAAREMAEMLRGCGVEEVVVMDLNRDDMAEAVAQAMRMSGMVVASPTYDAQLFPSVHDFLHHLALKGYRNRTVGLIENGSWAPIAAKLMRGMLESQPGITIVEPIVTVRSRLNADSTAKLQELAAALAAAI